MLMNQYAVSADGKRFLLINDREHPVAEEVRRAVEAQPRLPCARPGTIGDQQNADLAAFFCRCAANSVEQLGKRANAPRAAVTYPLRLQRSFLRGEQKEPTGSCGEDNAMRFSHPLCRDSCTHSCFNSAVVADCKIAGSSRS